MGAHVNIDDDRRVVTTTLSDGSVTTGTPSDSSEDVERAAALGYADVWAMTRDHDLLHCLLADALGYPDSAALWLAANPECATPLRRERAHDEECAVLLIQRLLNEGLHPVARAHGLID